MQVLEYIYYGGTLTVGVHTPRMDPTPATIFVAGTIHAEYLAKVRSALREYKITESLSTGLQAYLTTQGGFPLYGVRKIAPAGSLRSVDTDFNLEVTMQRFVMELAMLESTFTASPEIAFAFERHIEKAVKDLFAARSIPFTVIPGDYTQLGETFIDISFELGPASEQGDIEVAG